MCSEFDYNYNYGTQNINRIFQVIGEAESSNDIAERFLDCLEEIHAHVKSDVINFCKELGTPVLLLIRAKLFEGLNKLFSLENFELVERRKISKLAEEVYVMSFSLLNKLKHKRLEKMLREKHQSDHESDLDQLVDNSENQHDIKKLLMAYLELEKIVKSQNKTISDLTNRVTFLESKMSTHSELIIGSK